MGTFDLIRDERSVQDARSWFEGTLPGFVSRRRAVEAPGIIPNHHFSAASTECTLCFALGNFYAAISLSQAIAESISKFVLTRHQMKVVSLFENNVRSMRKAGLITEDSAARLRDVWKDRNEFHHLNPSVATERTALEQKALTNVHALAFVEAELFAYGLDRGALVPAHPEYWDSPSGTGTVEVFLRLDL